MLQLGLTIKRTAQATPDAEAYRRALAGELVQYCAYYAPAQLVRWAVSAMMGRNVVDFSILQAVSPYPLIQKYVSYIWCTFEDEADHRGCDGSGSYPLRPFWSHQQHQQLQQLHYEQFQSRNLHSYSYSRTSASASASPALPTAFEHSASQFPAVAPALPSSMPQWPPAVHLPARPSRKPKYIHIVGFETPVDRPERVLDYLRSRIPFLDLDAIMANLDQDLLFGTLDDSFERFNLANT